LRHGHHHEVFGMSMSPAMEWLLSVCFCSHCVAALDVSPHRVEELQAHIRRTVTNTLARGEFTTSSDPWGTIRDVLGDNCDVIRASREGALETLLAKVVEVINLRSSAKVGIVDFGPLYRGGLWDRSWENGVNLGRQAPMVDEVYPTFYFQEASSYPPKVAEYCRALDNDAVMIPVLRALLPETSSLGDLQSAVDSVVFEAPVVGVYNYGTMSIEALGWIGEVFNNRRA
jgi:hypothetical protein